MTRVNPQTHLKQDSYFQPELKALLDFFWPKRLTIEDLTTLRTAFLDRAEQVVRRQIVRILSSLSFGNAMHMLTQSTARRRAVRVGARCGCRGACCAKHHIGKSHGGPLLVSNVPCSPSRYTDLTWPVSIDLGFSMGWHMNSNWDEVPDGHDPNYVLAPTAEAIAEGGNPCLVLSWFQSADLSELISPSQSHSTPNPQNQRPRS